MTRIAKQQIGEIGIGELLVVLVNDVGDVGVEACGGGLAVGGCVGAMVVLVDVPDVDRGGPLVL